MVPEAGRALTAAAGGKEPTMIDEELRAILACPACKGELIFEETRIIWRARRPIPSATGSR
jgi:hypothetical protein